MTSAYRAVYLCGIQCDHKHRTEETARKCAKRLKREGHRCRACNGHTRVEATV